MKNYIAQSTVCCIAFILFSCVIARESHGMHNSIELPGTGKELHIDLKNFSINDDKFSNNGNTRLILAEQRASDLMVLIAITKVSPPFKTDDRGFGDPLISKNFYMAFFGMPMVEDRSYRNKQIGNFLFREYSSYFKISRKFAFHTIDTFIAFRDYLILVKVNKTPYKHNDRYLINKIVDSISIIDKQSN